MRTTLTLDDDVERLVADAMHSRRASRKAVINDAIRRALSPAAAPTPYRVEVHHATLLPGIDPAALNGLVDELEDDDAMRGLRAHP